ncbi:hypothetical protein TWF696_003835 [Orbilia brochopaga]|uniref:Uncharacterized protein n=1 Tax=Orbilia brochopaga TaxID=3140254 RepID=A0AAV9V4F3_9PEZI
MLGPCDALSVWIHETGHQLDSLDILSHTDGWFSGTPQWKEALSKDSCAVDAYANTSPVEDFAQVVVIGAFKYLSGYLPSEETPGCLDNRLNLMLQVYGDAAFAPAANCTFRREDSPLVARAAPPDGQTETPGKPIPIPIGRNGTIANATGFLGTGCQFDLGGYRAEKPINRSLAA